MAGNDTTPGAVKSTRFPPISRTVLTVPTVRGASVDMDVCFKGGAIKAVWLSEIGDAT